MTDERWLPADWEHPLRVDLWTGHHLRPIRAADTELDMVAVLGSQERLFSIYGDAWGWPPATMTAEQDRKDLQRHADEIERHESFNYALFDEAETVLLGCVYVDPPEKVGGADAEVSWWVVDACVGTDMIYSPLQALQALTRFQRLEPGDLVLTGTPVGTALSAPETRLQKMGQRVNVTQLAVFHAEEMSIGRTAAAVCISGAEGTERNHSTDCRVHHEAAVG